MSKRLTIPPELLQPPAGISSQARVIWRDVVTSFPRDYFTPGQAPLLLSYCESAAMAAKLRKRSLRMTGLGLAEILTTIAVQERLALAAGRSLRLTNQAMREPPQDPAGQARRSVAQSLPEDAGSLWKTMFPDDSDSGPPH